MLCPLVVPNRRTCLPRPSAANKMVGWILLPARKRLKEKELKDYEEYQSDKPRLGLPKADQTAI